jgi:serine/threonine protein kinase
LSSYVVQQRKVEDNFTIIDKLGRGAFGYVVLAEPKINSLKVKNVEG